MRLDRPVQFFEKSGRDAIVFLSLASQTIAARIEPHYADRYRQTKAVPVLLPLEKLSIFDAHSGRRM